MRMVLIALLILCSSPAWATNWCDSSDGCWTFEENTGTTTEDLSPNSNTGTFKGSGEPAWSTGLASYSSYAVDGDGTDDYISMGDITTLDGSTSLSIVFFINPDNVSSSKKPITKWGGTTTDQVLLFQIGTEVLYGIRGSNGNLYAETSTNASLSNGTSFHIAGTWTATNTMIIYVNGTEKTTNVSFNGAPNTIKDGTTPFCIFAENTTADEYNGQIDDVAIFSSVLDVTDINDIMDNGLVQTASAHRIPTSLELRNVTIY